MSVSLAQLVVEHSQNGFAINTSKPRLSLRYDPTDRQAWTQTAYEVEITTGDSQAHRRVESAESVLIPWPFQPLRSRQIATVRARTFGKDGIVTSWIETSVEVALLEKSCWQAAMIGGPKQEPSLPKKPLQFVDTFTSTSHEPARLYATAWGIYDVRINGTRVGDQLLTPGWTSYHHRLAYQTYDVTHLLRHGENEIRAHVVEGWYSGRLGKANRNVWGEDIGIMLQLEIGGSVVCATDATWTCLSSTDILESEIYNGEVYDTKPKPPVTYAARTLAFPTAQLHAPQAPPVRAIMTLRPIDLFTTPSGKRVLDFGQNMVGYIRLEKEFDVGTALRIRHAEVMEDGELGTRPLRTAAARWEVRLGGRTTGLQPSFTFFGFRYAEVEYEGDFDLLDFTGVVISSDLRRTGHFESSHEAINKLHENVVWGMRGNFVSIPTDCPQRDERLGWTGDIQVFSPTANFLYDTSAFLYEWLSDVAAEQKVYDGVPPIFVPWTPPHQDAVDPLGGHKPKPHGAWADVVAVTPHDMYQAFGDIGELEKMYESMVLWLEIGVPRRDDGLWSADKPQYGDWLDPKAPSQFPAHGRTDYLLPANAYLVHTTGLVGTIAEIIGRTDDAVRFRQEHSRLRQRFRDEYVTKKGRLASDTQTALTLALNFGLVDQDQRAYTASRLEWLIRWEYFKICTGFAGTPLILHTLADNGLLPLAYRMLQERDNPSWLYSVNMGATTIWERWDSMLPDGSINPGQMTSFNHYALGSVASFLHATVAGLSPSEPGWRRAMVKPQPGGTFTWAAASFESPYGLYSVKWYIEGGQLFVKLRVPPNGSARVVLYDLEEVVGSGSHERVVNYVADPRWPPEGFAGPQSVRMPDRYVA